MSQPRASSGSATTVNRAASAPSNGYEPTNQLNASSQGLRRAVGSVREVRAPPATSTAEVAAAADPGAADIGVADPGVADLGVADPGVADPGVASPGRASTDVAGTDPGYKSGEPAPHPANSAGTPVRRHSRSSRSSSELGNRS